MATLNVPATTNFSAQNLTNIDTIQFGNGGGNTVATFTSQQFGPGKIETDVLVSGGAGNGIITVNVAGGATFSAANWTFANWATNDQLNFFGTSAAEHITGSAQNDTIGNLSGSMGIDILDGGDGDDRLRLTTESGGTLAGAQFHGGNGTDELTFSSSGQDYNFAETTISGIERIFFINPDNIARFDNDQVGAGKINAMDSVAAAVRTMFITGGSVDLSSFQFISTGAGTNITITGNATVPSTLIGSSVAETITGGRGSDTITGGGGADTLDGGRGNDRFLYANGLESGNPLFSKETVVGGLGADRILLTAAGAYDLGHIIITEVETLQFGTGGISAAADLPGSGSSLGRFSITTVQGSTGIDRLTVNASNSANTDLSTWSFIDWTNGTDILNIVGTTVNDRIVGSSQDDIITGGDGTDTLNGGLGNDTLRVDAGDIIIEGAGGGTDTVATGVSFVLVAGAEVEVLRTSSNSGTSAIDLTGNAVNQTINGNAGANILRGGGGTDTLNGLAGNDTLFVDSASDVLVEAAGGGTDTVAASVTYALASAAQIEVLRTTSNAGTTAINLTGNALGQTLTGNAGANRLDGKDGNDVLNGLGGADIFRFSTTLGAGNIDEIADYSVAADQIEIDDAVFAGLGLGTLADTAFIANATGTATSAAHRILYDTASGALFFDANGSAGGGRLQFATLDAGLLLVAGEFAVV